VHDGIITGYPDGAFGGGKNVTRAEAAAILWRVFRQEQRDPTVVKTVKQFLQIALLPVGETMYVWGGGWNEEDTAAGPEAMTIGVSPRWREFFNRQTSGYDYRNTRYQIHDGLDCSGFVGWALYNLFPNDTGYVMFAKDMVQTFANYGWGTRTASNNVRDHKAGDIMGNNGHVWISLGTCSDGSVVILHSSPQGVMINGTQAGSSMTDAVWLAEHYMKNYFPLWYDKFPDLRRGGSYLTDFDRFRWNTETLADPEGYRDMDAAAILADLFKGY
jgi:hypothetical protein